MLFPNFTKKVPIIDVNMHAPPIERGYIIILISPGKNIDDNLIEILYKPSQRENSNEAFRGFINLFNDYLATDLFDNVDAPIQLIWGEKDPWESLNEAREWKKKFSNIKRLDIVNGAGHCPHDEEPEKTNKLMNEFIQETK